MVSWKFVAKVDTDVWNLFGNMKSSLHKNCLIVCHILAGIILIQGAKRNTFGINHKIAKNLFTAYFKTDLLNQNGPTEIQIGFYINDIVSISEFDMKLVMNFYFKIKI